MPRRTDAGGVDLLLHELLVPERQGLLNRHAGQSERLTDPGGQDHVRLPQTLHLVDRHVVSEPLKRSQQTAFVGERDMFVV
jgi:hypothetical protein